MVQVRDETNMKRLRDEDVIVDELYSECRSSRDHAASHRNTKREKI